ncbi:DUF4132 domain-containing protein [Brachyspira pilosicoli]|uniref:DUF4132 domain-containing protein n=1 Tax=Brachyspira pilosicoli TaxID=52584 RepID=A0A5C8FAI0_BRAPL|nr:DUF4132 domain-containing protein [Brachyspira pilosicoli]TXJ46222.1 DUF4132 domain-containing protein [Brachyspira pilosicoli]
MLSLKEINEIVEKSYKSKYDKTTSFIDNKIISNVFTKDKSSVVCVKVIRFIIGAYLELKESCSIDIVDEIGYSLDEESFREALEKIYINFAQDNKTKNVIYPYCIFASNSQINKLYKNAKNIASKRFKYACFIMEAIFLSSNNIAFYLIYEASKKFKQVSVRNKCRDMFYTISHKMNMTEEEFADIIMPNFGFDREGIRIIKKDDRIFRITLKDNFSIDIFDESKNKQLKTFPKDFPIEAKNELSALKTEAKKILKIQTERLIYVFMNGRKWRFNNWRELFLYNPFMKMFAVNLVWAIYDKKNTLLNGFRYMEDGTFNDINDEEIFIKDDAIIGLLSPVEVKKSIIEKWQKQILDYEIEQPFEQLSRKTKNALIKNMPKVLTVGVVKNIANKFSMIRDDVNGIVTKGYVFYDDYNDASIYIKLSNVYYASNNNDETEIEIKFNEYADERFKYSFYLILSSLLK